MPPHPPAVTTQTKRLPLSAAFVWAGVAFVVVLALERWLHPLLLASHQDRVLKECGKAALLVFVTALVVHRVKRPWN
jgi:hypothetical protein